MDFSFTPEEKNFRAQVRAFLDREVSDEFLSNLEERGEVDFSREFSRKLAQKGWSCPEPSHYKERSKLWI